MTYNIRTITTSLMIMLFLLLSCVWFDQYTHFGVTVFNTESISQSLDNTVISKFITNITTVANMLANIALNIIESGFSALRY